MFQRCFFQTGIEIQIGIGVLLGENGNFLVTGPLPLFFKPRFNGLTSQDGRRTPDTLRFSPKSHVKFVREGYVQILHCACHVIMTDFMAGFCHFCLAPHSSGNDAIL